ncbi:MAG: hypothetical protein Phyf2KO_12950 [Phycisphaerales bacterium]
MRLCPSIFVAIAAATTSKAQQQTYLVAASDSIQRYSLDGDYLGDLVSSNGDLVSASQMVLSPDKSRLYVGTFRAESNVSIFNANTGEYLGNLDDNGPLQAPSVISYTHKGNLLVSDFTGGKVYEYDIETNERLGSFFRGGALINPHEVLQVDSGFLVSDYGQNRVLRYDLDGNFDEVVLSSPADGISRPLDMLLSDDGSKLYVSNNGSGRVTVYDTATNDLLQIIGQRQLTFPEGLAWAPDGSLVVSNAGGGTVLRFDVNTGELLDTFEQIPGVTQGTTDVLVIPTPGVVSGALILPFVCRRRR